MGPSVLATLNAPILSILGIRRFVKKDVNTILSQVLRSLRFLHSNGVVHGDLES